MAEVATYHRKSADHDDASKDRQSESCPPQGQPTPKPTPCGPSVRCCHRVFKSHHCIQHF